MFILLIFTVLRKIYSMACAKGLIITLLCFYMFTAILGKQVTALES